jgi:hypothetical protein
MSICLFCKIKRTAFLIFGFGLSLFAKAQSWKAPINPSLFASGTSGTVGQYAKLATVNGYPAMVSYDKTHTRLMFVRALDSAGTTWNTPVFVDLKNDIGKYASLCVVNGNPAISYYDATAQYLKYIRAYDQLGTVWSSSVTVASAGSVGQYTSMTVVNGYPAISYYDVTNGDLYFVRASDANGSTWGTPFKVDGISSNVGQYTSLAVVNGYPAISYYDVTNADLKYVQASAIDGSVWSNSSITIDASGTVGQYSSLCVAGGNPAISYYDGTNGDLKYVQASNVDGTAWNNSPITIDASGLVGQYTSLSIVNGNPAISYYDVSNVDLKYVRASNANGSLWNSPISIDATDGQYTSLSVINGRPAVGYYDGVNRKLRYQRAADISGSSWGGSVASITVGSNLGQYNSLKVVNGMPAMAYYDATNLDLIYIQASNVDGTAWNTPVSIDVTGDVGSHLSLCVVNGNPAISYYDVTNGHLKYARANDINGSSWGAPITADPAEVLASLPAFLLLTVCLQLVIMTWASKIFFISVQQMQTVLRGGLLHGWKVPEMLEPGQVFAKSMVSLPSVIGTVPTIL